MKNKLILCLLITGMVSCAGQSKDHDTDAGPDVVDAAGDLAPDPGDADVVAGDVITTKDLVPDTGGDAWIAPQPSGLAKFVNPIIGTGGMGANIGSAFVGAALPFSMAKPGPDTRGKYGAAIPFHCSGYWYHDDRITGFSQMHLHGTGAPDYGALGLLPFLDENDSRQYLAGKLFPTFKHENETAFPGYYGLKFDNGIRAEMTTTGKAAIHRYTFPGADGWVGIDVAHRITTNQVEDPQAQVDEAKRMVTGSLLYKGSLSGRNGGFMFYFAILFDQPFKKAGSADAKIVLHFSNIKQVVVRIGISMVDAAGALKNLEQAKGLGFDQAVKNAVATWNKYLGVIELTDKGGVDPTVFYTSLYHSLLMPDDLSDTDGRYTGFDDKIHQGKYFFSDFSGWDTFRTVHPLYCLLFPDAQAKMLRSLMLMKDQGGFIPNWPIAHGYGNSMFGNPGNIILVDSYFRGFKSFGAKAALDNMVSVANGAKGGGFSGRDGAKDLVKYHYIPADKHKGSVSKTLEDSLADFCISRLANDLGETEIAATFKERSNYWKNLFDPATGFFRPKNTDGSFVKDFNPTYLEDQSAYIEGSAWQYLFDVPQDVDGLAELLGGKAKFVAKLNEFFEKSKLKITPYFDPYYWHGNEPDLPAPFMFVEAGQGNLTDKWSHKILENCYANRNDGLSGNDDAGTLGAWYVLAALGLFPRYCKGDYLLFSPLVNKAILHLPGGDLTIERGKSMSFNGKAIGQPFITNRQLKDGGILILPEPR